MRTDVERTIAAFFERLGSVRGALVLVAYSGGIDSSALLAGMAAVAPSLGIQLRALHVDHGLRPCDELAHEQAIVRLQCARLAIPLRIAAVRPGAVHALASKRGSGIEAAARAYRYNAFMRTLRDFDAQSRSMGQAPGSIILVTAHSADDQVETLLMRFLQGAGTEGLRGILPLRPLGSTKAAEREGGGFASGGGKAYDGSTLPDSGFASGSDAAHDVGLEKGPQYLLARPLLSLRKEDLAAYVRAKGLSVSEDSTNSAEDYARNRLRHTILPALDRQYPGWRKALRMAAEKASLDAEALALAARPIHIGPVRLDRKAFLTAAPALRTRALLVAAGNLSGRERLSWRMAFQAQASLAKGRTCVHMGPLRVVAQASVLEIMHALDFPAPQGYFVTVNSEGSYRAGPLSLHLAWRPPAIPQGDAAAKNCLREGSFSFPLTIRSRRPGDSISTEAGSVRVDELFSSWKLPLHLRSVVPIVEDKDGIVAVLPCALEAARTQDALASEAKRQAIAPSALAKFRSCVQGRNAGAASRMFDIIIKI